MKLKTLFGVVLMSCSLPGTAYLATDNDKLSYSQGVPGIVGANEALTFKVELKEVKKG